MTTTKKPPAIVARDRAESLDRRTRRALRLLSILRGDVASAAKLMHSTAGDRECVSSDVDCNDAWDSLNLAIMSTKLAAKHTNRILARAQIAAQRAASNY